MVTGIRTLLVAGALVGSVMLAGCQSSPFGTSNPFARRPAEPVADLNTGGVTPAPAAPQGLPLATEQRFKDVPLPVGVKEDLERSYVYESAALQIGRMVYTSRESVNSLANFFIAECPAAQWKLEHVVQADGADLEFRKPGKRLHIQIRNLGTAKGRLLIVNLTPTEGAGGL